MFVACQWPNVSILCSIEQVMLEIHQKCVVHMRRSALDLPRGRNFGVRDYPSKLMFNGPSRLGVVTSMGWLTGIASATSPSPQTV